MNRFRILRNRYAENTCAHKSNKNILYIYKTNKILSREASNKQRVSKHKTLIIISAQCFKYTQQTKNRR